MSTTIFQGSPASLLVCAYSRVDSAAADAQIFGISWRGVPIFVYVVRYISTWVISTVVGSDISQTFPLMNDETVRPLVCVMSIAVFELWRARRTVRREEEK